MRSKSFRARCARLAIAAPVLIGALAIAGEPIKPRTENAEPGPQGGAFEFDKEAPGALECKRAPTGHVLVRCAINGRDPGWFIFDTGAGICVISTPLVEGLDLRDAGAIDAVGISGGESSRMVSADTLSLGPLTLHDEPLLVTDLSFLRPHLGEDIAGVIGYGVLMRCVAQLDLVTPEVILHEPDEPDLKELPWEPLELIGRAPAVHARFEGHEGVFRLDTGANGSVTINAPAVRELGLLDGREVDDAKLGGVGGYADAKSGTLAWFELGGVRSEDVPVVFALGAQGSLSDAERTGNIGVDLLRPFVMYFDYAKGRVAFVPRHDAEGDRRRDDETP